MLPNEPTKPPSRIQCPVRKPAPPSEDELEQLERIDRLPPHAPDAERGLLGCMLDDPSIAESLQQALGRDGEAFYDLRHREIYRTLIGLPNAGGGSLVLLVEALRAKGQLEAVGGMTFLAELQGSSPSPANAPYFLEIVRERAAARAVLATLTKSVAEIYESKGEWKDLADRIESSIGRACHSYDVVKAATKTIRDFVQDGISLMEAMCNGPAGYLAGFPDIDRYTMGFKAGEFIVIAGRPGSGKSALLLNIARNHVFGDNEPSAYFSMEMPGASLVNRIAGATAGVNLQRVETWTEADYARFATSAGTVAESSLIIDDTAGISILDIKARARELKRSAGIKALFIDYIQLVRSAMRRSDNRAMEVQEITTGLKELARELEIPVIAACSMNREMDRDGHRKPRYSDLRESGSIESDADTIFALYRMKMKQEEIDAEDRNGSALTGLCCLKQRGGQSSNVIPMMFIKTTQRFEQVSRVET